MATQNLSAPKAQEIPISAYKKFGIVVSDWNSEVTYRLRDGAYNTLLNYRAAHTVLIKYVPGSIELTLGAQLMLEVQCDAVITLGSVIKGETPHFDYVCQSVTQGITQLNVKYGKPVIFGVLTTYNLEQAYNRAGGKHGNKGDEAAVAAIRMANFWA